MDGWSIHPYSACFWKSHFVNLNGNAFAWEHNLTNGEWIKQSPTIHTAHLELIAEFEELKLNDFDLALKAHPAHDVMRIGTAKNTKRPSRTITRYRIESIIEYHCNG